VQDIIEVPIFRLSSFFDIFPFELIPLIDYIKIDAQGADLDIVKGAGDYLSERVVCITIEPENVEYVGTANAECDIEEFMNRIGFKRYYTDRADDPTYVNSRYYNYFIEHSGLHIFQH
jgi:hypothetical protein